MSGKRMAQPAKGKSSLWDSQHYFFSFLSIQFLAKILKNHFQIK